MTTLHQWHSLAEAADFLGVRRKTLRGYIAEGKYGLVGVRSIKGGSRRPYIGVRWDTVVAFSAKRSDAISNRGAKGGRPCSRTDDAQGECPRCQAMNQRRNLFAGRWRASIA